MVNICPTCGKSYKTLGRFKLHIAKGHIKDNRKYELENDHLETLIGNTIKKVVENKCYPSALRSEISESFPKNPSNILKFVNENWKTMKNGKIEKFYSKFYAKVVLHNGSIFSTLSNSASTLLLTKLADIIVCDFKKWFQIDQVVPADKALAENEIYGLQYRLCHP